MSPIGYQKNTKRRVRLSPKRHRRKWHMSPLPWLFRPAQDLLRFGPLTVDESQVRCAMSFLVVRLVPEAPVNGATFATYLDGLALQVFDANNPETPLSGLAYSSQLSLFRWQGQGQ